MVQNKCPRCGRSRFWKLGDGRLKCSRCHHRHTPVKSYWDRIQAPEKTKRRLLELFVFGVPAHRLRFRGSLSLKTIEKFNRLVRECIYEYSQEELETLRLKGSLELDETLFGGRKRGGKTGWGAEGKHLVFGIYKRNGKVLVFPLPNRKKRTLLGVIENHTQRGSLYLTDEYKAYVILRYRGKHIQIRKEKGVSVGRDNINGIEGFWSYAKNWLYQYRGVPKKNFPMYLKEIEFRFNNRGEDLFPLLVGMMHKGGKS